MVKKNLVANFLGQGWTALMGLAFIPIYIRYLGIEAYGLIGLFALLQAWLNLLDIGMAPTLGREMALFTGGNQSAHCIRDLLRSIEVIAVGIAVVTAVCIALGAEWIAAEWLKVEKLPIEVVAQAITVMGLVTALRFIEGIYRSSILGLQRQVIFNVIKSIMATLSALGAVAMLAWVSPTIQAFFLWQGLISAVTLGLFVAMVYHILPHAGRKGRFSFPALQRVWRFASGILVITFLALLLTQVDKVLLSKMISLSDYGYYTLASTIAAALFVITAPITQALYPRFCELFAQKNHSGMVAAYHLGTQLVSVIAGGGALVLIALSETFLRLWTQDAELAHCVAPLLSLLMLGNLLNGLMWIPYQTQLAHGWTNLTVCINIVAVVFIVPAILWVTPRYGAVGAAWVWVILNGGYVVVGIHFMYRRILVNEKWRWYGQDVLAPMLAGTLVVFAFRTFWKIPSNPLTDATQLVLAAALTYGATLCAAGQTRRLLQAQLRHYWARWKTMYEC